eukprot:716983-Alexandrium_andersonii.AAC.1
MLSGLDVRHAGGLPPLGHRRALAPDAVEIGPALPARTFPVCFRLRDGTAELGEQGAHLPDLLLAGLGTLGDEA